MIAEGKGNFKKNKKSQKKVPALTWSFRALTLFTESHLANLAWSKRLVGDGSDWWPFIHAWAKQQTPAILSFIDGSYHFEPVTSYVMPDETITVWSYADRLMVRALLFLIKPMFQHLISRLCFHLPGPSGVKAALKLVKKALELGNYRYFMRIDIKGYYASIDRDILFEQVQEQFDDPRVLNYLEQIIHIPRIKDAEFYTPDQGIHRRSSLSPFFGALYLSPLDKAFEKSETIFYIRYMDDILILTKTKRQFFKAKRRVQNILKDLKLECSRNKTKMGVLTRGFHFLGIDFKVEPRLEAAIEKVAQVAPIEQTPLALPPPEKMDEPKIKGSALPMQGGSVKTGEAQPQPSQFHVTITLHERSCIRALEKVVMRKGEGLVHPREAQH